MPTISVVMPVYSAEKYLRDAVNSVLSQSYADFELIMIDDGSTDGTPEVLKTFKDDRIRIRIREHRGLSATRNEALAMVRGEFVALMDADDVSEARRFETEIEFLRSHPSVGVVGSWAECVDAGGEIVPGVDLRPPCTDAGIRMRMLRGNCFVNGSALVRRRAILGVTYREDAAAAEDYDFWLRLLAGWRVANLPTFLYRYRIHDTSATQTLGYSALQRLTDDIRARQVNDFLSWIEASAGGPRYAGIVRRPEPPLHASVRPLTRTEYDTLWAWAIEAVSLGDYNLAARMARLGLAGIKAGNLEGLASALAVWWYACADGYLTRGLRKAVATVTRRGAGRLSRVRFPVQP